MRYLLESKDWSPQHFKLCVASGGMTFPIPDNLQKLVAKIKSSEKIILSTHKQCDGDGLGAELALFHALRKIHKQVQIVNVDSTPRKYRFMEPDKYITYFDENPQMPDLDADLIMIFDTNDERLVSPLFGHFKKTKAQIVFIDHHPVLKMGPTPTVESWINTSAASTGEMAYDLIDLLKIPLDRNIATALYTSITFDTQIFRFIRNSPRSHEIAARLLTFDINPQMIHKFMFGEQTVEKMKFLAHSLIQIEYYSAGRLAILKLNSADIKKHKLDPEDARDVIDFLMNIETLEAAALFREDGDNLYKLSLRSKGRLEVLPIAEKLGGGGHIYAAGCTLNGNYEKFKHSIIEDFQLLLNQL